MIKVLRAIALSSVLTALLFLPGCRAKVAPISEPVETFAPVSEEMYRRAESFKYILSDCSFRGAMIDFDIHSKNNAIRQIRNLRILGINEVIVNCNYELLTDREFQTVLYDFNSRCRRNGIRSSLLLNLNEILRMRNPNSILRVFNSSAEHPLEIIADAVKEFNQKSASLEQQFNSVTLLIEPHLLTKNTPQLPPGLLYSWAPESYGANGDNDLLMKEFLSKIAALYNQLAPLPMNIIIHDLYLQRQAANDLKYGSMQDFEKYAKNVIVILNATDVVDAEQKSALILKISNTDKKVVFVLDITPLGSRSYHVLPRNNFKTFLGKLERITTFEEIRSNGNFAGFMFDSVAMLEEVWRQ